MAVQEAAQGVLLCERPGTTALDSAPKNNPFLPSSSTKQLEPLGLYPTSSASAKDTVARPKVAFSGAADVQKLEASNREAAAAQEARASKADKRARAVASFSAALRSSILSGRDVSFWGPVERTKALRMTLAQPLKAPTSSEAYQGWPLQADAIIHGMDGFVDDLCSEAAELQQQQQQQSSQGQCIELQQSASSGAQAEQLQIGQSRQDRVTEGEATNSESAVKKQAATKVKSSGKPAWALTKSEALDLEAHEEEELMSFANNLDYKAFLAQLDDDELQLTLSALQQKESSSTEEGDKVWSQKFVHALNHIANKQSFQGASPREAHVPSGNAASRTATSTGRRTAVTTTTDKGDATKEWCGSSRMGDDNVARLEKGSAAREACEFLRENPELRAVHSPASVITLLQSNGVKGS